jgi:hypothetical protein
MLKLTWSQIAAWRVRRHHLDQRTAPGSMLAVASRLCGLHAQVLSSALLTLWARVEDLDRQAVQHALWQDRTQGAVHSVAPSRQVLTPSPLEFDGPALIDGITTRHLVLFNTASGIAFWGSPEIS